MANKKLKLMSSEALMAYSNVFESTFNNCIQAMNEMNEYIAEGFFKVEEIEPLFNEVLAAHNECKKNLGEIRAEIDLRLKANFSLKYNLERIQGIFTRFSEKVIERDTHLTESKKRLEELQKNLKVVDDVNSTE